MVKQTLILLLSLPVLAFGQYNSSIGLIAGIEYSYRNLSAGSGNAVASLIAARRDDEETGKLNWRAGFNYNRRLSSRLFLKTGVRLASVGYEKENKSLQWPSEHNGAGGWAGPDPNLPRELRQTRDYWFLELPVAGRYELGGKKLTPFIEAGLSPTVYLTTRTKTVTDISTEVAFQSGEVYNFNTWHLVGQLSFGFNCDIGERLQLFGQPTVRYHLTKLADAPVGEYLYNFGIEAGVRRRM